MCNHFYRPPEGTDEYINDFNAKVPLTLIYEYKVPGSGRLMPVWIGSHIVVKDFIAAGESENHHNDEFKRLTSGLALKATFWMVNAAEEISKNNIKLFQSRPFSLSCGGPGGPNLHASLPPWGEALTKMLFHLNRAEGGLFLCCKDGFYHAPTIAACFLTLVSQGRLRVEECFELVIVLRPSCGGNYVQGAARLMSPIFEHWGLLGSPLIQLLERCRLPGVVLPEHLKEALQDEEKWKQLRPLRFGEVRVEQQTDVCQQRRHEWCQLFPRDYPVNSEDWEERTSGRANRGRAGCPCEGR